MLTIYIMTESLKILKTPDEKLVAKSEPSTHPGFGSYPVPKPETKPARQLYLQSSQHHPQTFSPS